MKTETKVKLIYAGELAVIAIIAIVIGVLKLTGVIATKPIRLLIYNIITFVGGLWFIVDLIWTLKSEKRRKKSSLLDKICVIPISAYLLFFDIYCFIYKAQGIEVNDMLVRISVGVVLLYVGVLYTFQAIYHYSHPVPMLIEAIEEAKKMDEEAANPNSDEQIEEKPIENDSSLEENKEPENENIDA